MKEQLKRILSLSDDATEADIYIEIGRLKERADTNNTIYKVPHLTNSTDPNLHYHHGMPCYQNPCNWC